MLLSQSAQLTEYAALLIYQAVLSDFFFHSLVFAAASLKAGLQPVLKLALLLVSTGFREKLKMISIA